MTTWKLDEEEYYYKIYDSQHGLVGYFQPDYGKVYPAEKEEQIIQEMLKRHDTVYGGILHLPLLKLNLFSEGTDYDLEQVMQNLDSSLIRAKKWQECINELPSIIFARASKSHSDPDMLSTLLGIKFTDPVKLDKPDILNALQPILDHFQKNALL